MTILDAYQAIDEVVIGYLGGSLNAEQAMTYIASIIEEQGIED